MMAKVDKADGGVAMGTAEGNCKAEAEKFQLVVCQVEPTRTTHPRTHASTHPRIHASMRHLSALVVP